MKNSVKRNLELMEHKCKFYLFYYQIQVEIPRFQTYTSIIFNTFCLMTPDLLQLFCLTPLTVFPTISYAKLILKVLTSIRLYRRSHRKIKSNKTSYCIYITHN